MREHIIVTCNECNQVWDLDMMPEACACSNFERSIDTQTVERIETDNWREVVRLAQLKVET